VINATKSTLDHSLHPPHIHSRPFHLSDNPENRAAKTYVWDVNGRRHKSHGPPPPRNFYEAAVQVR
jgi:hypothetical protein